MNTDINGLTERIIGCAFAVANTLGVGFLEKVYENALAVEFEKVGLAFRQQHPIKIHYGDVIIGDYVADLLVDDRVLVELKSVQTLSGAHQAQCLNYLKATGLPICLLLKFGSPKVEIKRLVL